jgi:hypothetical protein
MKTPRYGESPSIFKICSAKKVHKAVTTNAEMYNMGRMNNRFLCFRHQYAKGLKIAPVIRPYIIAIVAIISACVTGGRILNLKHPKRNAEQVTPPATMLKMIIIKNLFITKYSTLHYFR